jgi:predicted dienelactone hydrolase
VAPRREPRAGHGDLVSGRSGRGGAAATARPAGQSAVRWRARRCRCGARADTAAEFGDLRAKAKAPADSDEAFRAALAKDSRSYRDKCLRAVFAMAPALGPAFTLESLEKIGIPVAIVAGVADAIMPVGSGARALAAHIPHAELTIFPGDVGHCVFLAVCTEAGRATLPALCIDAPLVSTATRSMPRPCGSSRRSSPAI